MFFEAKLTDGSSVIGEATEILITGDSVTLGTSVSADPDIPGVHQIKPADPPPRPDVPEYNGYRVGERVWVKLERPGPGMRRPQDLVTVPGVIESLPSKSDDCFAVRFEITEDTWDSWYALMPDQLDRDTGEFEGGSVFTDTMVDPDWIVGHVSR